MHTSYGCVQRVSVTVALNYTTDNWAIWFKDTNEADHDNKEVLHIVVEISKPKHWFYRL
jgi:hypothetical protein